jgi:hypothetical protein
MFSRDNQLLYNKLRQEMKTIKKSNDLAMEVIALN